MPVEGPEAGTHRRTRPMRRTRGPLQWVDPGLSITVPRGDGLRAIRKTSPQQPPKALKDDSGNRDTARELGPTISERLYISTSIRLAQRARRVAVSDASMRGSRVFDSK